MKSWFCLGGVIFFYGGSPIKCAQLLPSYCLSWFSYLLFQTVILFENSNFITLSQQAKLSAFVSGTPVRILTEIHAKRFFRRMTFLIKFIYFQKPTKFCKIFTLLLTVCTVVKSKAKISLNFVAFSEYMNFNDKVCLNYSTKRVIMKISRRLQM